MLTRLAIEEMKLDRIILAGLLCLVLSVSPAVVASSGSSQGGHNGSVPLTLGLEGLITNAGNQAYWLGGGQLVSGVINGEPVSPGHMNFGLTARVHNLAVNGWGFLELSGFNAQITINGAIPAAIFPLSPDGSNCDPTSGACNSEIPLYFTGMAFVNTGNGDPVQVPIGIESAYWDPLGNPIVITSLEPGGFTFSFVVAYSSATITWSGVQLQGGFEGTLGNEPVSGAYSQVTFSQENLLRGTESDFGTIAFADASDASIDGQGHFFGHTTFTAAGGVDCSMPPFNFPVPEGYCLATGATSNGSFSMTVGHGAFILGTYQTIWSVPSLFTTTTVIASMF